jgi:hypothetical protein
METEFQERPLTFTSRERRLSFSEVPRTTRDGDTLHTGFSFAKLFGGVQSDKAINDDLPPGTRVFDHNCASAWLRRIADDLAAEILPDLSTAQLPEILRYMEERGLRELRVLVEGDALRKRGPDQLRTMAHAMRNYALERPSSAAYGSPAGIRCAWTAGHHFSHWAERNCETSRTNISGY